MTFHDLTFHCTGIFTAFVKNVGKPSNVAASSFSSSETRLIEKTRSHLWCRMTNVSVIRYFTSLETSVNPFNSSTWIMCFLIKMNTFNKVNELLLTFSVSFIQSLHQSGNQSHCWMLNTYKTAAFLLSLVFGSTGTETSFLMKLPPTESLKF